MWRAVGSLGPRKAAQSPCPTRATGGMGARPNLGSCRLWGAGPGGLPLLKNVLLKDVTGQPLQHQHSRPGARFPFRRDPTFLCLSLPTEQAEMCM